MSIERLTSISAASPHGILQPHLNYGNPSSVVANLSSPYLRFRHALGNRRGTLRVDAAPIHHTGTPLKGGKAGLPHTSTFPVVHAVCLV